MTLLISQLHTLLHMWCWSWYGVTNYSVYLRSIRKGQLICMFWRSQLSVLHNIIRLFIRVCALFREKHNILETNKISKAEKTRITIKRVCFVFCWNILEIFFANSVGSVWSGSILFSALLTAKLFNGRSRQMICPTSIQSRATIGPPAKRQSVGVLLADR